MLQNGGGGSSLYFVLRAEVNKSLYIWTRGLAQQFWGCSLLGRVSHQVVCRPSVPGAHTRQLMLSLRASGDVCSRSSPFYGWETGIQSRVLHFASQ